MNGALDVLGRGGELHCEHGFGDQLAGHGPDDMHAEHIVVLAIGDQLHHPGRLLHAFRATVRREAERADLVWPARFFDLLLGLAAPGDLGRRVDDGGSRAVVHLGYMARDELGHHDALFHAFVRQHRPADDVTNGPYIRHGRAAMLVDLDEAALVERDLDVGTKQARRDGPAANRDDEGVDGQLLGGAARFVTNLDGVAVDGSAHDFRSEANVELLPLEMAQRFLRDLLIGHRQERLERFQDDDLGTEPFPDRAELETDDTGADDAEAFRDVVERERARRVDDALAIELRDRQLDRRGPRREHYVLRFESLDAGVGRDLDAITGEQLAAAFEPRDPACLEHRLDALRELLDDAALAGLHRFDVDSNTC